MTARARVLIVDDEPGMLEVCRDTLRRLSGVELVTQQHSARAAEQLGSESWDLLISDVRMPEPGGLELLRRARTHDAQLPVLLLTAYPSVETAVECMKLGAADYVAKPFKPEDLLATARRLLDGRRLADENRFLRRQVERSYTSSEIIGESAAVRAVVAAIEKLAAVDVDVLIEGETGTGKELVARQLHQRSCRRRGRFVPVDCGALPEALLESEFFGHERGAFTGADSRSIGLLEFASAGTFFLDELGQLPLALQAKLLRALQERRVRRVGGKEEVAVDVRIVAASALDIADMVKRQAFRSDLYYRINVARIVLPALREHAEDIAQLTAHFAGRFAREMGRGAVRFDAEALEVLGAYGWPGNVRELQNTIKRALVNSSDDVVCAEDLPPDIVAAAADRPGAVGFFAAREHQVTVFERQYFADLLRVHHGDVTHAAAEAQLPRGTLYRLLKKHCLNPAEFRG
jgi:DNA-binding NtrC family response regulator